MVEKRIGFFQWCWATIVRALGLRGSWRWAGRRMRDGCLVYQRTHGLVNALDATWYSECPGVARVQWDFTEDGKWGNAELDDRALSAVDWSVVGWEHVRSRFPDPTVVDPNTAEPFITQWQDTGAGRIVVCERRPHEIIGDGSSWEITTQIWFVKLRDVPCDYMVEEMHTRCDVAMCLAWAKMKVLIEKGRYKGYSED